MNFQTRIPTDTETILAWGFPKLKLSFFQSVSRPSEHIVTTVDVDDDDDDDSLCLPQF